MIYNIVPFEVFVWSYRTSDMYFVWDIAKIPYIKKKSIPIFRQSHHCYTMRSCFFLQKWSYTYRRPRWTILCTWDDKNIMYRGYRTSLKTKYSIHTVHVVCDSYVCTTITPAYHGKINIKMLIHINTNMIYNIVPLAVLVWSFRMSAMYFALNAAKMSHIDIFSIAILRQSHYWYTMRSWFFLIKTIVHIEKTTMNNIMHLESIKKEVVRPRNSCLRQCRCDVGVGKVKVNSFPSISAHGRSKK